MKNIVVVDDEEDIGLYMADILEDHHHNVKTFTDPNKALHYISNHLEHIHIILSDYSMPEFNGGELYKKVSELGRPIPFVIISGGHINDYPALKALCDSTPFLNFLEKPFEENQLIELIEKIKLIS